MTLPAGTPTPQISPPPVSKQTWKPTTAGILSIVAGVADIFIGLSISTVAEIIGAVTGFFGLGALGVPLIVLGILAVVGGIFALQRKMWGLALAGAICAMMWPLSVFGLLAVIFVSISKDEFK